MNLLKHFGRRQTEAYVDRLAREIAKQAQPQVWDRVRDEILHMNIAEARGYARARAAAVVRDHVATTLASHEAIEEWASKLLADLAMERTVHRLVTDLVAGGPWARRATAAAPVAVSRPTRRAA